MNPKITVTKDGPYLVEGGVPIAHQHIVADAKGESREWREGEALPAAERCSLCRCGRSRSKPFCDGTHAKTKFDGTETASRAPYERQAGRIEGPTQVLKDAESLCAFARFCDTDGQVWNLVKQSDQPRAAKLVEHQTGHCPSGRLVALRRETKEPIEPRFPLSIGLVQDPAQGVSGPLWVRGGIPVIAADGRPYEVRNRVTLCRCGDSSNKPFCDGSHASAHFSDRS